MIVVSDTTPLNYLILIEKAAAGCNDPEIER